MSVLEEEKGCESNEENVLYSFPAFQAIDNPLILELTPLPFVSDDFEQMPVGARGWYASAVLSAMMMSSSSTIGSTDQEAKYNTDTDKNNSKTTVKKGMDFLREDLKRACGTINGASWTGTSKNNVFLELGSGTIGLAGMTMAWIVAQQKRTSEQGPDSINSRNKVLLTDYDHICLEQLEQNAVGARQALHDYFLGLGLNDDNIVDNAKSSKGLIPDIDVARLDWNEYDQDQSPILSEHESTGSVFDGNQYCISFACGAALVYTEDTAACVDQVAKILRINPKCVVWVVQWPRNGWFNVFQQELISARFKKEGLDIRVQKFGPLSSPDMFSTEVQELAMTLMPRPMQQEPQMDIKYLRAIRIANVHTSDL